MTGPPTPGLKESRCRDWQARNIACQRCPPCLLQWSKDGRGVRVHAELYEEEMSKSKELFPELADLSCVAALKAWMIAYGFNLSKAK